MVFTNSSNGRSIVEDGRDDGGTTSMRSIPIVIDVSFSSSKRVSGPATKSIEVEAAIAKNKKDLRNETPFHLFP